MTLLLDAKTSQNASFANSIAIPISAINTPQLFARQTLSLAGATGVITTQFSGVIATQLPPLPLLTTITVTVVRGLTPSDLIVFSESMNLSLSIVGPQVLAFTGSDYNLPNAPTVAYSAYISSSALGTIRVGPESMNFASYST